MDERFFKMEVIWDEKGEPQISTQAKDAPIHDVVAALSQTLYKFNKEWTEKTGFTIKK